MGRGWKERFPDVPKEEIRAFLELFADAFLFKQEHRCRFSPDDKVLDVYKAVYPSSFGADAMELETFLTEVEQKYGVQGVDRIWSEDLTLGDMFKHVRQAAAEALEKIKAAQGKEQK
jgi:hypothetical protein